MINPPKRGQCLLALAAGATAFANHAQAFDPTDLLAYKAGPVLIRPNVAVAERFDDNIVLQRSELAQSDFVTSIMPGITLTLGRKDINNPYFNFPASEENYVSLNYLYNKYYYASHSFLDAGDHTLNLSLRIQGQRLSFEGSSGMNILNGTLGEIYNQGQNVSRTTFGHTYTVRYKLSDKTSVYAVGSESEVSYDKGQVLADNNTVTGTAGFEYKIRPKIGLFSEFYYGQSAVDPNTNAVPKGPHETFYGGFVGARGDFTAKLSGSIKAGYEQREFSDNSPAGSAPVVEASVSYRISDRTGTTLSYSRRGLVDVQNSGIVYDLDTVNLHLDQRFGAESKFRAGADVGYTAYSFSGSAPQFGVQNRADDTISATVNLSYLIKAWLTASLQYDFQRYSSNAKNAIDYTDNRVTLKLAVGY